MAKILKNTTGEDILINDTGFNVEAYGEITIDPVNYILFSGSSDTIAAIASGFLIYNDGEKDLDLAEATAHLQGSFPKQIDFTNKSAIQQAIPVINHKPEQTSFARATHDFTKKQTWYKKSIRVIGETLSIIGSTVFKAQNNFIIDVQTGIVNRQDTLQAYRCRIYVGGIEVIDGFTIDYRNGIITFDSAPSGVITCDYSYATTSEWSVKPDANKTLIIEHSEVQFTDDVEMISPVIFEVWIDNPFQAIEGHPLYSIPRIKAESVQYNSIRDVINESNLGYQVPAMAGLSRPVVVFPFNYATVKPLYSSMNAELIVRSLNDVEMTGSYGTATFYLVSRDS